MNLTELDSEIFTRVKNLNGNQKSSVLKYLDGLSKEKHSTRIYRSKALKQIRKALGNP